MTASKTTKPRVTLISESYARVSHRELTGHVIAASARGWASWLNLDEDISENVSDGVWSAEGALARLLRAMDLIADCRELAILVDRLEGAGLRTRIDQIGGTMALAAFDGALGLVQAVGTRETSILLSGNSDRANRALVLINGMIKAAGAKRSPTPVKVAAECCGQTWALTILPGFSVTFDASGRTYYIGSQCEAGSYNLHSYGTITSITAKTVTAREDSASKAKRLKADEFAWRNHDGVEAKQAKDRVEMQYI